MTISSMTGFACTQGQFENYSWIWEIRSVNGRGLDIRMRIPPGLDSLDQFIKTSLKKSISRGSINITLQFNKDSKNSTITVNETALDKLIIIAKEASKKHDLPMPSIDSLLSIRDIVEINDNDEDEEKVALREQKLQKSFLEAIDALKKSREEEGAATKVMLSNIIDEIEKLLISAEKIATEQPQQLKEKFQKKLDSLFDNAQGLDEDRLTQEIVILATKADIKEETDRLHAHIAAARNLLNEKEPVGRKFDFLTQEFNRETNTLCSKSSDITLTNIGLTLKTTIDQLREQVQNIE